MILNSTVSIVVPVYNVERYLEVCLESLCNQLYANIEIILINDDSSDGSGAICKKYSQRDARIVFISQKHAGTVAARRKGVEIAKGEYITFVDSDDYVFPSYIEELIKNMKDSDIATSKLQYGKHIMSDAIPVGKYAGTELENVFSNMLISSCANGGRGILTNMCGKMFKTALVREVIEEVNERIYYGEDAEFVYRYLLKCSTISITDYCGYVYRMNDNSVCHVIHDDYLENLNYLYLSLKSAFGTSNYEKVLIPQLQKWIVGLLCDAPQKMGFQIEIGFRYIMPVFPEIINQKVILYGAGVVGNDYMRQLKAQKCCSVVAWVDKRWNHIESSSDIIQSPECIENITYNYIVIALNSADMVETVIDELVNKGSKQACILWKKPIKI